MIYLFLADGFEEAEALVPLDILRRAGLEVNTVGVERKNVTGAHGITVKADITDNQAVFEDLEGIILPGGMPGTLNLENSKYVQRFIDFANEKQLIIGAICAAPSILGHKNLLCGKSAVCFPGFEKELLGAKISDFQSISDGNIITAVGAGAAFDFGFLLLSAFKDEDVAKSLKKLMQYKN